MVPALILLVIFLTLVSLLGLVSKRAERSVITGRLWLYALLSLTAVRMLPVALSLVGTKLQPASVLFLGWFGPRGLASVILGLVYLEEQTRLTVNSTVVLAMIAAVLLSVLAHGVSANPAVKWYARQVADLQQDAPEYA